MVNRAVPADRPKLRPSTWRPRGHQPGFGLKLAKESVNLAQETQGLWTTLRAAFGLHELAHAHNLQVFGMPMDPSGLDPKYLRAEPNG